MGVTAKILYNRYLSATLNSYHITNFVLENYAQVTVLSQGNILQQYVLYPALMSLIKHKAIVLIVLAFL